MTSTQRQLERELFQMAYDWGNAYIITDELCNAFQDKLKEYREEIINSQKI